MHTTPSISWPRMTSSIESATTSRLTSEVFIPSVPIVTPSLIAIVLNSMGVPPAARMPALTTSARWRWLMLQGIVSIQVVATPTIGLARSSSVKPMALSIARAPARSGPSVRAAEWRLAGSDGYGASDIGGLLGRPGRAAAGGNPTATGGSAAGSPARRSAIGGADARVGGRRPADGGPDPVPRPRSRPARSPPADRSAPRRRRRRRRSRPRGSAGPPLSPRSISARSSRISRRTRSVP